MSKLGCIRLIAALSAMVCAGTSFAQTISENQAHASTQSSSEPPVVSTSNPIQDLSDAAEPQMEYAPALDGSGLISMDSAIRKRLLVGATISGGWDSNPYSLVNGASSEVYSLSPYLGVQANTTRTQFLLQYKPTITGYSSNVYSNQTMHAASVALLGTLSERWKWDINGALSYGNDSTRLLAPQQSVAVGEVPGAGPASASYLPNAGTVTYVATDAGVHYRTSVRSSIEFGVANTLGSYTQLSENNRMTTTSLGYDRALSTTIEMRAYGQTNDYYGSIDCASIGGGVGVKWNARDRAFLSLSGGPQVNMSGCGKQQILSFSAAFSARLSGKSQVYVLAAREPTVSNLGPGVWLVSASGGYQRQVVATGTLSIDLGYASSYNLITTDTYHDIYVNCIYAHTLGHGLSVSYSYRGSAGDTGGTSFSRSVALFSLAWTPSAGRLFQ
jgi:hypothetical protein